MGLSSLPTLVLFVTQSVCQWRRVFSNTREMLLKYLLFGFLFLAVNAAAAEPAPNGLMRVKRGAEVGTLEKLALTYLSEVAYVDRNFGTAAVQVPVKVMLRDRDGLSEAQAEEVIAAARKMDSPEASEAKAAKAKTVKEGACSDLKEAKSVEQSSQVLEAKRAQEDAEAHLEGVRVLAELTPATRAAVRKALVEYRKSIESSEPDWSEASPEMIERYKSKHCGDFTK